MRTKKLTLQEVEYAAYETAKRFMEWDEPIPAFGSRFPNKLESCLEQPFLTFGKKDLYRGLVGKAAILFYLMIKNHPFENGNKRIAVTTILYFFFKHDKWLRLSNEGLYLFALEIAESDARKKDREVVKIQRFLNKYMVSNKVILDS